MFFFFFEQQKGYILRYVCVFVYVKHKLPYNFNLFAPIVAFYENHVNAIFVEPDLDS